MTAVLIGIGCAAAWGALSLIAALAIFPRPSIAKSDRDLEVRMYVYLCVLLVALSAGCVLVALSA